jgi:adenine C2-methylase RlmN of 23S rRNA A2503 and tRNA A37
MSAVIAVLVRNLWCGEEEKKLLSRRRMGPRRKKADQKLKSIWDEVLIDEIFTRHKASKRNMYKMWNWMIAHPTGDLNDIPFVAWCVPKAVYREILENYVFFTTKIIEESKSIRGDTTKLLIELQDGHRIETVVIEHRGHTTVCVSSQVGCQMGCKFCATGTMGIIGDLTSAEILEQVVRANMVSKVRNVVYMGMGEPLQNYENLKLSVEFLVDTRRFALSSRHITVSTVGVVKYMQRLTDELGHVNLALSLHAPNQEIRLKIVPTAVSHHIDKLMSAIDYHVAKHSRTHQKKTMKVTSVMIEYILIKDINDRDEHAHELCQLLLPRRDHVLLNLIPYNPTDVPGQSFEPPTQEQIDRFYQICTSEEYKIFSRVRQEMGQDIAGACGQLALKSPGQINGEGEGEGESIGNSKQVSDIEDLMNRKTSSSASKEMKLKKKDAKTNQTTTSPSPTPASAVSLVPKVTAWWNRKLFNGVSFLSNYLTPLNLLVTLTTAGILSRQFLSLNTKPKI